MKDSPRANRGEAVIGDRISEYKIEEELGKGGFGTVYRAVDTNLNREVALKVMHRSSKMQERLRREARMAAALDHRSIVKVLRLIERDEDSAVIVMEYVDGQPLASLLDDGPLSLAESVRLLVEIAGGLGAAHARGIVHRDLNPRNVMVTTEGRHAKVLDFGIAKSLSGVEVALTTDGTIIGSINYLSPEQADTGRDDAVDHRSDFFSFGTLAYLMLTGTLPFQRAETRLTIIEILKGQQDPIREVQPAVPQELSDLVDDLLKKDPKDRPQSAANVIERLQQISQSQSLSDQLTIPTTRKDRAALLDDSTTVKTGRSRHLGRLLASGVAVLLILLVALVIYHRNLPPPTVAVLGFDAAQVVPAWTATGLAEIVAVELAAGDNVRLVDRERVADSLADLSLTLGGPNGLDPEHLKQLKRHLQADYLVLGGAVRVNGKETIEIRLQSAADGKVTWEDAFDSTDVFATGDAVAKALRGHLRAPPLNERQRQRLRSLFPNDPEAARLYFEGSGQLRRFGFLDALDSLEKADAREKHPRVLDALAAAFVGNGNLPGAKESGRQIVAGTQDWPHRERLTIQARYYRIAGEWEKAAEVYRELFARYDSIDDALHWVELIEDEQRPRALETMELLRERSLSVRSQAWVDLVESRVRYDLRENARALDLAQRAFSVADEIGASLLGAQALFCRGLSLDNIGQSREALAVFESALPEFERANYVRGVEETFHMIALAHVRLGELDAARSDFERLLRFYGDNPAVFTVVNNLCYLLVDQGHVTGARALMLETRTGIPSLDDWDLAHASLALGLIAYTLGDLEGATEYYREARRFLATYGDEMASSSALTNLGEMAFLNGRLDDSRTFHEKALAPISEPQSRTYDNYRLGKILAVEDKLGEAALRYQKTLNVWGLNPPAIEMAYIYFAEAELELWRGNVGLAAELAEKAEDAYRQAESNDEAIVAQAFHWQAQLRLGRTEAATKAAERVLGHAAQSESWHARLAADFLAAEASAATREMADVDAALTALDALAADAAERGFVGRNFEIRLVQGRIEADSGRREAAEKRLEKLITEASERGYTSVKRRASVILGRG